MSESGISRAANFVYDKPNKRWVREPSPEDYVQGVFISGVVPVGGKLPVDTEISISGNVIVQNVDIRTMPLTEVYASGTFPVTDNNGSLTIDGDLSVYSSPLTEVYPSGIYAQTIQADDLVAIVQYNESDVFASHTTISGMTYTSSTLGTTVTETFASGTNYVTITRVSS